MAIRDPATKGFLVPCFSLSLYTVVDSSSSLLFFSFVNLFKGCKPLFCGVPPFGGKTFAPILSLVGLSCGPSPLLWLASGPTLQVPFVAIFPEPLFTSSFFF